MEPYKTRKLPFDLTLDRELLNLLLDAKESYGEYKGYLKTMNYDYKLFLESLLVNDIYYSFKIDNSKLLKSDMFYMPYKVKNNESETFNNLKRVIVFGLANINSEGLTIELLNKLHKELFNNCKKDSLTKGSGKFRKKQTYLLKPGIAGSSVSFITPLYTEVNPAIKNMCEYVNNSIDDSFISSCLTHFQFERVHPYISGNGKLGRVLLPIQLSYYKKEPPILFISESIDNFKNTYFTVLSTEEEKDYEKFLKFLLKCFIEQCSLNVKKIKKLNKIYNKDLESFKELVGGTTIYKIYPYIIKRIVFTTHDIVADTSLHINSVNKVLNKLVETGFLVKEKKNGTNRVTFKYTNMFNVFCE